MIPFPRLQTQITLEIRPSLQAHVSIDKAGIQFGYVGIDGGYGKEPAFFAGIDEQGCRLVADVH